MSDRPLRPCPRPNCGRLHRAGGICPRCAAARDQARGSASDRGYDAEWAAYSRAWLARFPWCGQRLDGAFHVQQSTCARQRVRTRATVTDHIVGMKQGGAKMDPANHQSLCAGCNARKGIAFEGGFGRPAQ